MTVALLKYYERNQQKSQTKFMKTGYSIRTWRMRLVCPEPIWLDRTEEYFQNVVEFYYHLLRQHEELWNSSLFDIQRSLELLTLTGRDGRQPTNPLPMGKVPVYLRRAAINKASATVKSTQELQSGFPEKLEAKVTFFKGMYSDLTDRSICLKLWNGEKWIWTDCNLKGRPLPQDGQLMSPTVFGLDFCILVSSSLQRWRYASPPRQLCTASCFPCSSRMQKSRPNTVGDNSPQPNRKYYMHLKNLSEHYAHQVSREILNFCKENQAGIIVLPDYDQNFTRMAMVKSGNFSPLHLSSKIRTNLQYKAWAEGILVLETRTDGLKDKCAICGGKVRRKGNEFLCENGHQGNRFLNDARNLGRKCQDSFFRGSRTK